MTTRSSLDRSAWASMAFVVASETAMRRSSIRSSRKVGSTAAGDHLPDEADVLGPGRDLQHHLTHRRLPWSRRSRRAPRTASSTLSCSSMISSSRVSSNNARTLGTAPTTTSSPPLARTRFSALDDDAEADRVDEVDPRQVEHDAGVAVADEARRPPDAGGARWRARARRSGREPPNHRSPSPVKDTSTANNTPPASQMARRSGDDELRDFTAVTTPAKPVHSRDQLRRPQGPPWRSSPDPISTV